MVRPSSSRENINASTPKERVQKNRNKTGGIVLCDLYSPESQNGENKKPLSDLLLGLIRRVKELGQLGTKSPRPCPHVGNQSVRKGDSLLVQGRIIRRGRSYDLEPGYHFKHYF